MFNISTLFLLNIVYFYLIDNKEIVIFLGRKMAVSFQATLVVWLDGCRRLMSFVSRYG